jgi:hypothetical protein
MDFITVIIKLNIATLVCSDSIILPHDQQKPHKVFEVLMTLSTLLHHALNIKLFMC